MTHSSENRDIDKQPIDKQPKRDQAIPPAGPHAKPKLIDPDKTPGSGVLPNTDEDQPVVEGLTG